jgi:hypothetical protein
VIHFGSDTDTYIIFGDTNAVSDTFRIILTARYSILDGYDLEIHCACSLGFGPY